VKSLLHPFHWLGEWHPVSAPPPRDEAGLRVHTREQKRIAALEGGIGALAVSSGQSAQFLTISTLAEAGDNIVASSQLYGGTYNQMKVAFPRMGVLVKFVTGNDPKSFEALIDDSTKVTPSLTLRFAFCRRLLRRRRPSPPSPEPTPHTHPHTRSLRLAARISHLIAKKLLSRQRNAVVARLGCVASHASHHSNSLPIYIRSRSSSDMDPTCLG